MTVTAGIVDWVITPLCDDLAEYRAYILGLGAIHHYELQEPADPIDPNDTVCTDLGTLNEPGDVRDIAAFQVPGPPDPGTTCLYAMEFTDSPNSRIEAPVQPPGVPNIANSLPGDFTVMCWAQIHAPFTGAFRGMVQNQVNASPDYHWALYLGGTVGSPRLGVRTFTGGVTTHMDAQSTSAISAEQWYFQVGRYNDDGGGASKVLEYFQNGVLTATDNTPSGTRNAAEPQRFSIGTIINGPPDMDICLVSAFNYRISDQNIADLYEIMTT